jgi:hypothetical protein
MDHELDEAMLKMDRIADRRIQEAINAGEFDNLPGYGKPLTDVDDNPFVPKEMRAAFKVLANSGYAPDWMVVARQIEADVQRLRYNADRHFTFLSQRLAEIATDPFVAKHLRKEMDALKAEHRKAAQRHSGAIEEINRKITSFNHMVPIASLLMVPLSLQSEMEKFEDRLPAFLSY